MKDKGFYFAMQEDDVIGFGLHGSNAELNRVALSIARLKTAKSKRQGKKERSTE